MTATGNTVLIMAGGTGGHIYPGLAFADALREKGVGVRWLGAEGGMECSRVAAVNIPLDLVRISGVRGKGIRSWLRLPFRLLRAVLDARASLKRNRPDCAVSFGGYVAGPGGLAAWSRGIPLVVHEQNRIPGLTNRVLARLARKVLQAFPGTFTDGLAQTCGNPVRDAVVSMAAPSERFENRSGSPRLLVTGGSQGARSLNQCIPAAVALLPEGLRPMVWHQSGRSDVDDTIALYKKSGVEARVEPFIEDMASAYSWADLVICRSGALTISELAAAGLGSVLVPFPHAVDDHQAANAEVLVAAGAARMIRETGLTPPALAEVLEGLLGNRDQLLLMANKARKQAVLDSAQKVVAACSEWFES
ncbi:MAG: undecaprenyldiphospho-muramoylpentapeptide beta-N-acetylglucosaminyltransferase [Xanthomonadales bacterium]|nr:undecaprenyldiphospho-muramoylpentapeptide beta-N-acetylglucosaminyltransferase [Gammaproteobacteria bacterium]NNE06175.1 undecaprenyldiphospho-muramoylpentapeptide beta-N-acetylglucosaminyltransferase [Xanthomonadales bacterium]NNL95643.1 undecaprenyldiphospho-muramoylpentapeptide beta-N-acetylglucosaminyltransferase [Xanthomonadales bacterium]